MTRRSLCKLGMRSVFALGDQVAKHLRVALVFHHFEVIEPVLYVAVVGNDAQFVPFAGRVHALFCTAFGEVFGGDEVVQ